MPYPALTVLCAKLQVATYDAAFVLNGTLPDLSGLGRMLLYTIWGDDWGSVGEIPYGFISGGPDGIICSIRGTEFPKGSLAEALDDLDAFLEECPFAPGQWHRGFGRIYRTLVVKDLTGAIRGLLGPILATMGAVRCHGHSLGADLACYASLEAKTSLAPILFASPKWGDTVLTQTAETLWESVESYANPNDVIPQVPLTVDFPWLLEDFQPITKPALLNPRSVNPPVPSDWLSSHSMVNYLRLLEVQ